MTISPKSQIGAVHKESKPPALKKRRCSTSDKPNDVTIGETHKKSKLLDTCDIYNRPNVNNVMKIDNPVFLPENNGEKKTDGKGTHVEQPQITANGKNCTLNQVSVYLHYVCRLAFFCF